jgi:hypothetical protein
MTLRDAVVREFDRVGMAELVRDEATAGRRRPSPAGRF